MLTERGGAASSSLLYSLLQSLYPSRPRESRMTTTTTTMATTSMRAAFGRSFARQSLQQLHHQHVQSIVLRSALPTISTARRSYSTTPSSPSSSPPPQQQQRPEMTKSQHATMVLRGPTRDFVLFISGVARFSLKVVAGVVLLGATWYEGTHQYIEFVAMPKEQLGGGVLDGNDVDANDAWGWTHDYTEETWVGRNPKGTDARLGFRGRHQVRSAWSTMTWGGGVQATSRMGGSGSLGSGKGAKGSPVVFYEDEGTRSAERLLYSALITAERKGIRLPDMAAIRAGLPAGQRASTNESIDKTAVMLEYRLASLRERIGGNDALRAALAGYTRLYDALATLAATNRAMQSEGSQSGQPGIRPDRLVRLATKVGDLHNLLGNRSDAERWLVHAVELAGGGAELEDGSRQQDIFRNEIKAGGTGELARMPAEVQAGQAVRSIAGLHSSVAQEAPITPLDTPPSPSLTRSLISSLLSLSGFHAQPSDQSALEQALQYQASALRLTRIEMGRLEYSSEKDNIGAQLHKLWLQHHDGLACVHIGETIYGIRAASKAHATGSGLLATLGLRRNGKAADAVSQHEQTLAWLQEARSRADTVLATLVANADTRRPDDTLSLSKKWAGASIDVQTQASRLLRDAQRLRKATTEMTAILTAAPKTM